MRTKLLLLPVISLVLGGCSSVPFLNKAAENVSKTAEEKVAEQAVLADCKFDKDACKYMASAMTMMTKPVMMKSDTSDIIMDGKGNMQMIGKTKGVEDSNMISLDNETYMKDYEKKVWMWYKANKSDESASSLFDPKKITEDFKEKFVTEDMDEYVMKKLGEESCGESAPNLTCFKYDSYMSKTPTDKTITWFDTKNYLPRRIDSNYADSTTSILYYYDNVPQIVKPSPIQEFVMPTIPEGATGQMPTQADIDALMKQYGESDE